MRILYAIQGTGLGHITRSIELLPLLQKHANVTILLSGFRLAMPLPFKPDFMFQGLTLIYNNKGGVDLWKTFRSVNIQKFIYEINQIDPYKYDLVISDFEPISAWACLLSGRDCIGLSHQAAVVHPSSPKPKGSYLSRQVLRHFAPCSHSFGFHFDKYHDNIYYPVIRKDIRLAKPTTLGHYSVYLPAYSDKYLIDFFSKFSGVNWHIFSPTATRKCKLGHIDIFPTDYYLFTQSLKSCDGIICGAGFETPAEALYLRKKLIVIPMKDQFEQACNSLALQRIGVISIPTLHIQYLETMIEWLYRGQCIATNMENESEQVIQKVLTMATPQVNESLTNLENYSRLDILKGLVTRLLRPQVSNA